MDKGTFGTSILPSSHTKDQDQGPCDLPMYHYWETITSCKSEKAKYLYDPSHGKNFKASQEPLVLFSFISWLLDD